MLLHQVMRSLRRAPVYALVVILTLALGLASVGVMYALVQGVLYAPLPYAQPERLVRIQLSLADGSTVAHAPALAETYRRHATSLDDVAIYRIGRANVGGGQDATDAENLPVSWMSASLLPVLGVAPAMGRTFTPDEARRGGPDAVILSDREWRTRYAAAPDVIGRTLVVNDVVREIVGVMPAGFAFVDPRIRMWLPAKSSGDTSAGDFFYTAVARLAPAASAAQAEQELAAILPRMAEQYPALASGGSTADWIAEVRPTPSVQDLRVAMTAELAPTLWLLAAVAVLVLAVAAANVTSLALVRADATRRDVAVRAALGAGPLRAAAHGIGEWVVLGVSAAVLALLTTAAALWALRAFAPAELPRMTEIAVGPGVVAFILMLVLVGLAGVAMLLVRSHGWMNGLHDAAGLRSAGAVRQRLRTGITVLQLAAALVVVAGSTLLLRTADRLHDVDPGFDADGVTVFQFLLPFARYPETARVAFHARLREQVMALQTVSAAGLISRLPLTPGNAPEQAFRIDGTAQLRTLPVHVVGDGFFAAMRIPLVAGRDFRALESQRPDELIINRRAAQVLFADAGGTQSIGRTLTLDPGGPRYTVVGVVGDVRDNDLATPARAAVYRPQVVAARPGVDPGPLPGMVLAVRASGDAEPLVAAVRAIVRGLDPGVPVFEARAMGEVVQQSLARLHLMLGVVGAAAAVSLLMGMLGLYGVMAYLVTLRTREFGLRIAVGAMPARVARSVVQRGLALAVIGVLVGLPVFALAATTLRAAVVGVQPWDPLALALAIALLLGIAALATWLPARRAAAIDPARALRAE